MIQEQQQQRVLRKQERQRRFFNNEALNEYFHTQVQYALLIPPSCSWKILAFNNAQDCNV